MKTLAMILMAVLAGPAALASECPNLSGTYQADGTCMQIEQVTCDELTLTLNRCLAPYPRPEAEHHWILNGVKRLSAVFDSGLFQYTTVLPSSDAIHYIAEDYDSAGSLVRRFVGTYGLDQQGNLVNVYSLNGEAPKTYTWTKAIR